MVYSALSDSTTRNQFTRRKGITITTDGTNTPDDYQVKLTITYESEMQADFDDLRFNTRAGEYIDYWIESYTASTSAIVWVELPDAITDPGSDTIVMYYGNDVVSSASDGDDTFLQYHGSASSNFLDSVAAPYTNISIHIKWTRGATTNTWWGLGTVLSDGGGDQLVFKTTTDYRAWYYWKRNDGGTTDMEYADEAVPAYDTNPHISRINYIGDVATLYIDDVHKGTSLSNDAYKPNQNMGLGMYSYSGTASQEWSFVRKYIANEPTPSYSTAQHQRRVPQFIG